jgi:hypothetical protein
MIPVEVKDSKGKLSPRQEYMITELKRRGVEVHVIYNDEQLDAFLESL